MRRVALVSRIAISALFVMGLFVLAQSMRPLHTTLQAEFEEWKSAQEPKINLAGVVSKAVTAPAGGVETAATRELPKLTLKISNAANGSTEIYEYGPQSAGEAEGKARRILRLLDLMEAAGIFNLISKSGEAMPENLTLRIDAPDRTFEAKFNAIDVADNIQALLLLRLFKEYAGPSVSMESAPLLSAHSGLPPQRETP